MILDKLVLRSAPHVLRLSRYKIGFVLLALIRGTRQRTLCAVTRAC